MLRPGSVGNQTRLRRILRGLHPTRNEEVTKPWPIGRSPPNARAAASDDAAPLLGNQAAWHAHANGLEAMAEATALDAPELRKPAGLEVTGDTVASYEGDGPAASLGGGASADGLRGMLPTNDGETGTPTLPRRSLPWKAFEANDVATPLLGNQAVWHCAASRLDAMAEAPALCAPELMTPAGIGVALCGAAGQGVDLSATPRG